MNAIQARMDARDWAMLVVLSVLWGGSFFFVEVALRGIPPLTLVWLRVGCAAVLLHLFLRMTGRRLQLAGQWRRFAVMGLLNNAIPFSLLVWSQTEINGGLAAILNATTPLWTVLAAHLLTSDEKLTLGKLAGVTLGFAGVASMLGLDPALADGWSLLPILACLVAALSYALAGIYGRRFKRQAIPPLAAATGQLTAAGLLLAPLSLWVDRPWQLTTPTIEVLAAVTALVVLSTMAAYVLYFRLLAAVGATNLLLVTLLVPAAAIQLGAILLGEVMATGQWLGLGCIATALVAIDGRVPSALGLTWSTRSGRLLKHQGAAGRQQ
ncbi:MAG TPA: EamA family transporter [Geminicoccus sp.]|jgi:drug/metabolite transporter (DMT)-like permease|uniref:DMT family transporter n=1 Tax=Geminicoccus sp. TaxID=2024832 RepID=UPI002E376303|nr:EamA family transporter [Geminicoccus sp.]HEX2527624.1 EamA family transporter [Geminicoccus sp.]